MKESTSNQDLVRQYQQGMENIPLTGRMIRTITRADGSEEVSIMNNIVVAEGLNQLAAAAVSSANARFAYLAIGTQTAAHSLGSTQAGIGEVDRKAASTLASSNEVIILVATWAGNADSVTSLDLRTGAIFNHANSGSGTMLNAVNSVATVLADSDFLKLQAEVQVGSHNE